MNKENQEHDALFRLMDRINEMQEEINRLTEENQQLQHEVSQNKEHINEYRNVFNNLPKPSEMTDMPPEFLKVLHENYWDLLC